MADQFLVAVGAVIGFKEIDGRDSIRTAEAQQVACTAHDGIFYTRHAPEGKVVALPWNKAQVVFGHGVPGILYERAQVLVGCGSGGARLPNHGAHQRFEHIGEPEKLGFGIAECQHGYAHGYATAFGQSLDFQGQIPQVVQVGDMIHRNAVFAQVVVHAAGVKGQHLGFWQGKKLLVELALQILFDEILQSEKHDFIHTVHAGFSGCHVGIHQGSAFRVLEFVANFIAVF